VDGATRTTTAGATTVGIVFVGDLTGTLAAPSGDGAVVFQRSGTGGNTCVRSCSTTRWTFKVTDGARLDTGSVRAVSIELTGFVN
jgi:subtilisin-like proprotein convertase family protein